MNAEYPEIEYAVDVLGPVVASEVRELWWQAQGLIYTSTGYGRKIPTTHMVKFANVRGWRRVYCCIFSNSGTCYVRARGKSFLVVRDHDILPEGR